jgi:hypothetical protein
MKYEDEDEVKRLNFFPFFFSFFEPTMEAHGKQNLMTPRTALGAMVPSFRSRSRPSRKI